MSVGTQSAPPGNFSVILSDWLVQALFRFIVEAPLGGGGGGVWVSRIPLVFGQNIPYPVNSCGLYPYWMSVTTDDVNARNMFGY